VILQVLPAGSQVTGGIESLDLGGALGS